MRRFIITVLTLTVTVAAGFFVKWLSHQISQPAFIVFCVTVVCLVLLIARHWDKADERERRRADELGLARLPRQAPEVLPPQN